MVKIIRHKKILAVLLAFVMLFSLVPVDAIAAGGSSLGTVKVRVVDQVKRIDSNVDALYAQPFGEILPWTEVEITEGLTVRGALEKALAAENINVYGAVDYVEGIGPVTSADGKRTVEKLSEFDGGAQSGWMVSLNDWFIKAGANTFTVQDGDVVEWCYTCDLGADLGADFNSTDTSLKALSVNKGVLSPVFAPGTKEYTLSLSAATKIMVIPTAANKNIKVTINSGDAVYRSTDEISVVDKQVITVACGENTYKITVAITDDQGSADAVTALITALPALDTITLEDKAQVEGARVAYDQLTEAQKELVTNYSVLVEAEKKIAQIDAENKAKTDAVIELINALPAVDAITLDNQEQIDAARTAYNALSAEQKALVDNLAVLTAAEEKIAVLLNPGGSVAKNYRDEFLLSTLDLEMNEGEREEIVIFDIPRVGSDDQAFNRDDLIFEIKGEDLVAVEKENIDGTAKGLKYYIKGLKEGIAEIKISYDGYEGQDAIIAVNVKKEGAAGPTLKTDIGLTKYDILYFTGDSMGRCYNFG